MIGEDHPFRFLMPLFEKEGAEFYFSRYVYTPDALFDEREYLTLSGKELSEGMVSQEIASLRPDQELAFHSKIRIKGKSFHVPMIDFTVETMSDVGVFGRMSRYLPKAIMLNMAIYASGRSFHAYSTTLLAPGEWIEFMGRLLLVNQHGHPDIVDSRWVGHRLIGGFGALRWSNNSGQYLGEPTRVTYP